MIPGDEGYSDFWHVNLVQVPAGYEANSIRSVQEVMDSGYEMVQPGLLVNCPIVRTDAAADTAAPEQLPTTGGAGNLPLIAVIGIGTGLLVLGGGLALNRRAQTQ